MSVRYASQSGGQNPHLALPSDTRTDTIRQTLYPPNAHIPSSASPTGAYHPQYAERVEAVIVDSEAHETIERAWKLFQREKRESQSTILTAKFNAMKEACEELDKVTEGTERRYVFERAMARPSYSPPEEIRGKKGSEARFLETRLEGMVPREAWVPVESRGKGWNYEWKRPGSGKEVS